MTKRFIRQPAVEDRSGLCGSTIWQRISEGTFPKPIKLGVQAVGWIESEIDEWMDQMIEASRGDKKADDRAKDASDQKEDTRTRNPAA